MTGFRKGEGKATKGTSENWQKSKLWNCKVCGGEKVRNRCRTCDKGICTSSCIK